MAAATPTPLPLRVRGPGGGQPTLLSGLTSASTLAELEAAACAALGIREGAAVALLAGFPPRPLGGEGGAEGTSVTLGELGLRANEVVMAKEETGAEATVLQGQGAMPGAKRGKKAAGGGGSKRPAAAASAAAGSSIHTLHGRASASSSSARSGGGGGGGVKRRRVTDVGVSNEEDIGALLLSAVGKGGGGGRVGACMRAVFRKAMEKQFDEAKAGARVAAVAAGPTHYEIEESQGARRADGSAARLKVRYHKGLGFRSAYEDEVDLFSVPQLAGTVALVLADTAEGGREMLKPANMAGCSPRVFWSLVHHFGPDVEAGLRQLLPTHTEWAFLHERTRKLSEKALASKEQEEEVRREKEAALAEKKKRREARLAREHKGEDKGKGKGKGKGTGATEGGEGGGAEVAAAAAAEEEDVVLVDGQEGGAGAAAVGAGEAMDRERRAQAALARLGGGGGEQPAAAAAAASENEGGKAGGQEEGGGGEESEVDSDFPEIVTDAWVKVFRAPPFNITCCKELAAADSEELTARLEQHHATGAAPRLPYLPDEDTVEAWAAACRSDELDEMMLAVVGGDDAVLDALELVHIALPQDVALWASMPQTLLDTMRRELPEERWAAVEGRVTVEAIAEWAARAQRFAETVDWLRFWVTN